MIFIWDEPLLHAAKWHNRPATPILHMKTPLKTLFGTTPDNSKLGIFACMAFVGKHTAQRIDKLDNRAAKEVHLTTGNGFV